MNKFTKFIKKQIFLYFHIKKGRYFSKSEKRKILKIIELSKKEIIETQFNSKYWRGTCTILADKCYTIFGIHKTNLVYGKLKKIYHNPSYYKTHGLPVKREISYWWDKDDRESRLKALDILKEAIIND